MSVVLGLFIACGALMMLGKPQNEQAAIVIFLTVWALSALIAYCVLPYQHKNED